MSLLDTIGNRFRSHTSLVLRLALAATFVLFAVQKLRNPGQGAAEIALLFPFLSRDLASLVNFISSIFELLVAASFVTGAGARLMGLLGSGFIATIVLTNLYWSGFSVGADMYRDIGLIGASFAIFLLGK